MKERRQVKYSFDDDDMDSIFSELLAAKSIKLPEPKRPAEVNKTKEPNYCRYHRLLGHTLKDCYILKDIIQEMINNQEIEIDSSASANVVEEGPVVKVPSVSPPKGATKVAFQVGDDVKIVHAYPDMLRPRNPKILSLYELMNAPSLTFGKIQKSQMNQQTNGVQ